MTWDLQTLRTEFRALTGRPDADHITDDAIDARLNAFYQHQFPDEASLHEFEGFTTFVTVAGTETYSQPGTVLSLNLPLTIMDSDNVVSPLDLYTDVARYKEDYPDDAHDESAERNQPEALLLLGRTFYLRPVPDAVYTIKYLSRSTQPTALSGDSDVPDDEKWGPLIAHGAAIELLMVAGQNDEADGLKNMYTFYRQSIARKQLQQYPLGMRAAARL